MNRLVLAVVLLGSAAAASTVSAYQIRRSGTGEPLRWAPGNIAVDLALDGAPEGTDPQEATAAARRAFAVYTQAISSMTAGLGVAMQTSNAPSVNPADQIATVIWVNETWADDYDPDALAVTVTTYDSHSGRIDDADIVINGAHSWSTGDDCGHGYDLQGVLAHEVGHLFGLGHDTDDTEATMYPSAGVCETKKRDLDVSDLQGLRYLYVDSAAPPQQLACAVAPGGRGEAGSAALFLGIAAFGLAFLRRWAAAAALLVAVVSPAGATTMRKLDLAAAGKAAGMAVRGTVKSSAVKRIADRVYTDVEIAVAECMKGTCAATVTIRQLGGEIDGEGLAIEGSAEMTPGSEVVVLLRPRRDGTFSPVGMAQGVYRIVERDPKGAPQTLVRDTRGLSFVGESGGEGKLERVKLDDLKQALR